MDDRGLQLYVEDHPDGRSFASVVVTTDDGGLEVRNRSRAGEAERRWGRGYSTVEAHAVVALLGGGGDDLPDPAMFLHRMAAAGDLPTDQPLDGWLAEHGISGRPLDVED